MNIQMNNILKNEMIIKNKITILYSNQVSVHCKTYKNLKTLLQHGLTERIHTFNHFVLDFQRDLYVLHIQRHSTSAVEYVS